MIYAAFVLPHPHSSTELDGWRDLPFPQAWSWLDQRQKQHAYELARPVSMAVMETLEKEGAVEAERGASWVQEAGILEYRCVTWGKALLLCRPQVP